MTSAFAPALDRAGIGPMHAREGAAQPVRVGRHQDQMHMVRHQAPGPHLDVGGLAIGREQIAVARIVAVAEEGASPAIATLGDMMGMSGDHDAGETGHAAACPRRRAGSIECTVTVLL